LPEEDSPVTHDGRDPQIDLVRRYARILRSAPAEALRAQQEETLAKASVATVPLAVADSARATARPRARRHPPL
jgi:hypothetical protein